MTRRAVWVVLSAACLVAGSGAASAEAPSSLPVLLVHGMAWDLSGGDQTWGSAQGRGAGAASSGMIGYLESRGLRYGGRIRPRGANAELPLNLDTTGVRCKPQEASVFALEFSAAANVDGVAFKALELAESIGQLCRFTGAAKVRLVAHSAGGLVARAYVQNALPGVAFRHDVDRLVTIATPHLGSSLAAHFGDFLGTRATSITPDAPLIAALNGQLELPDDVEFASIVVRGIAADVRGEAELSLPLVDESLLTRLPVEYRLGGDQVVHVTSQNLRLARTAARYEARTGRPVQYMVARVPDPTPDSWCWNAVRVHVAATSDPGVERLVAGLVDDKALLWSKASDAQLADWVDWQARLHAEGQIEATALDEHPLSEVSTVRLAEWRERMQCGRKRQYEFAGKAWSENYCLPCRERWTSVSGTLLLAFDEFGRVASAESSIR